MSSAIAKVVHTAAPARRELAGPALRAFFQLARKWDLSAEQERTLLGNPAFVVLDEPNANLDAEGEDALMRAIDAMKANGATVVIISHKPGVFRAADKMLVLRDGRVELFGPVRVVTHENAVGVTGDGAHGYAEAYRRQARGDRFDVSRRTSGHRPPGR